MATGSLALPVTVTLDGSGNGTVSAGPLGAREVWTLTSVACSVSTNNNEATFAIYVGDRVYPGGLRDQSFSGSSGDSSDRISDPIKSGWKIWGVWAGGDPGAIATMSLTGTREI